MLAVCIAATGLLLSMQYRVQRADDERQRPSKKELEEKFEEGNEELDYDLVELLRAHREACRRSILVTDRDRGRYDELEAMVRQELESDDGEG